MLKPKKEIKIYLSSFFFKTKTGKKKLFTKLFFKIKTEKKIYLFWDYKASVINKLQKF